MTVGELTLLGTIVVTLGSVFGAVITNRVSARRARETGPIDDMGKVAEARRSLSEELRADLATERTLRRTLEAEVALLRGRVGQLEKREHALTKEVERLGGDPAALNGR